MTKVSIVIVTWNNAPHIAQAMESCLWPSQPEVIVIHNASGDGTLRAIADVTARHPGRFRLIDNPANIGLGPARNQGIEAATGDHLLFLDGDDWFLPEAEAALLPLLTSDPDLVAFGHRRVWDDGRTRTDPTDALLFPPGEATARRSALVASFSVAWNKVYRRALLLDHSIRFPAGLYEDIPVHIRVLATARQINVTPAQLVAYRQRDGSITRSQSTAHADMLDRFAEVAAFTATPAGAALDRAACALARARLFSLLLGDDRLAPRARAPFLAGTLALLLPWRRRAGLPGHDRTMRAARVLGPRGLIAAHRLRRRLSRKAKP